MEIIVDEIAKDGWGFKMYTTSMWEEWPWSEILELDTQRRAIKRNRKIAKNSVKNSIPFHLQSDKINKKRPR